jgi:hypothetical protein
VPLARKDGRRRLQVELGGIVAIGRALGRDGRRGRGRRRLRGSNPWRALLGRAVASGQQQQRRGEWQRDVRSYR